MKKSKAVKTFWGTFIGAAVGLASYFPAISIHDYLLGDPNVTSVFMYLSGLIALGMNAGYLIGYKKHEKDKEVIRIKKELKGIDQKLSHYETKCQKGDFVLVDNEDIGYSVGEITGMNKEKLVLSQRYEFGVEFRSHSSYLDQNKIICVLEEGRELSIDDLKALSEKNYIENPIVVHSKTKGPPPYLLSCDSVFFKGNELFTDYQRKYANSFFNIDNDKLETTTKLLTPVIKKRIKTQ